MVGTIYWKGGNAGSGSQQKDPDNINNWVTASGGSTVISTTVFGDMANNDIIIEQATAAVAINFLSGTSKLTYNSIEFKYHASALNKIVEFHATSVSNTNLILTLSGLKTANGGIFDIKGTNNTVQIKFTGVPAYTSYKSNTEDLYVWFDGDNAGNTGYNLNTDLSNGIWVNEGQRSSFTFLFEPPTGTVIGLDCGLYPKMDFDCASSDTAQLSPEYIINNNDTGSSDNTFPFVSMLDLSIDSSFSVKPRRHDYEDRKAYYKVEGPLVLQNEIFDMGFSSFEIVPTTEAIKLPVSGAPSYGVNNNFKVKYSKVVIGASSGDKNQVLMDNNTILYCEEFIIMPGGRLYGPSYGSENSAEINTVKPVKIEGDWNFGQIAEGVYRTIGTSKRLDVSSGGTGLNNIADNSLLYGNNRGALSSLAMGSNGEVLAVESGSLVWSATAGGGGVTVQEEGSTLSTIGTTFNFVGTGVTATGTGATKTITVSGGEITVKEEGSALSTAATTLDFVGNGVVASGTGTTKTITITDTDTVYSHPTGAGNKHIPAGGASGNFLKYDSAGTAVWATPSYTTDTNTTTTADVLAALNADWGAGKTFGTQSGYTATFTGPIHTTHLKSDNVEIGNTNEIFVTGGTLFFQYDTGTPVQIGRSAEEADLRLHGDLKLGSGSNKVVYVDATAHNVVGKSLTLKAGDTLAGTTDNIAGGNLILEGGQGKGTGAGGNIVFKVADGGAANQGGDNSYPLNSLATALTIFDNTNATFTNDVTIGGNLTVSGSTTTIDTNIVNIGDSIITLNSDETGTPSQDGGIEIERGTSTNKSFYWDESEDKWSVGSETMVAGTFEGALTGNVTGNVSGTSGSTTGNAATATALATARAINGVDFDGTAAITVPAAGSTLTDTVTVAKGGTGATTLASNAVLTGNGTSAITAESTFTYDGAGNMKIDTGASGSENDAVILLDGYSTSDSNRVAQPFVALNDGDSVANMTVVRDGANDAAAITLGTQPTSGNITERMRITSAGNVGIGTTAPDEALEIMNGVLKITREETEDSSVTEDTVTLSPLNGLRFNYSIAFDNNNPVRIGTDSDQDVAIRRNAGDKHRWFWNDSRSYLNMSLEKGTPTFAFRTTDTDIAANDVLGQITFSAPYEGTGTDALLNAGIIKVLSEGDFSASSNASAMTFSTGASEAATEKMRITSDGKVGIGDTTPTAKLEVAGTVAINSNMLHLKGGGDSNHGLLYSNSGSLDGAELRGNLGVRFTRTSSGTEMARINATGMGIGTTTPVSALDMNTGAISFATTNTQLKLSGGSNVDFQLGHWGNTHILIDTDGNDTSRYFSVRHGNATAGSATELFKVHENGATTVTGTLDVSGGITGATKEFVIEHPTKPNMKLHHGSLEGPEHAVYIRGKNNSGTIHLPDYWEGLVDSDSITVQLTAIGNPQELYVREIKNGKVRVAAKSRGKYLEYFYFIQAERKDVEKLEVEECLE